MCINYDLIVILNLGSVSNWIQQTPQRRPSSVPVHRLSRVLLTCPAQVQFRLLTCSVTFVFSLTKMFVFCPGMWCLTYTFPSVFVRLLVCSLFPRCISLLEVRMSCRLVSLVMFQCYPWRCRGAWRMLSIRQWFFFKSPYLCFSQVLYLYTS